MRVRVLPSGVASLYLARHGRPRIDPTRPASEWPLADPSDPGTTQLRDAHVLPIGARWVSSPEPKAHGTATVLRGTGVDVCVDLVEQKRGARRLDDQARFEDTMRRAVSSPAVPAEAGWEPVTVTAMRVVGAVRALMKTTAGDLVLVGHGTAWTPLVAELTSAVPDLAAWRSMRLPDACVLDVSQPTAKDEAPLGFRRRRVLTCRE